MSNKRAIMEDLGERRLFLMIEAAVVCQCCIELAGWLDIVYYHITETR